MVPEAHPQLDNKAAPPHHHTHANTIKICERLTITSPSLAPKMSNPRPSTPDQSPQLNTTRGVKGWAEGEATLTADEVVAKAASTVDEVAASAHGGRGVVEAASTAAEVMAEATFAAQ